MLYIHDYCSSTGNTGEFVLDRYGKKSTGYTVFKLFIVLDVKVREEERKFRFYMYMYLRSFSKYLKFPLELRPKQHQAVNVLLQDSNVLTVLPTGRGKSLIF